MVTQSAKNNHGGTTDYPTHQLVCHVACLSCWRINRLINVYDCTRFDTINCFFVTAQQ